MKQRDLIIIGGGAGGLVVASVAAQLGLSVTLIEKGEQLGGDCLHTGCVPSKTLLHTAKLAAQMRGAGRFGLHDVEPEVDMARVSAHVQSVIAHIQQHDDPERFRGYGCEVLLGKAAEFVSPHTVRVGDETLRGRRFVIATGSSPAVPPIPGLAAAGYLTNLDLFSLQHLPRRLLVLGGGPIGLEMAQAFARLGSEVTVVEAQPQLLPREEPALAAQLQQVLGAEGIRIHTDTKAEGVESGAGGRRVHCSGGLSIEADEILVALGRRPNVDALGLDAAGVHVSAQGIVVDRRQRTSQHHIYACGDVCGPYAFTHMAEYQAGVVIGNAIFRVPKKTDYRVVPWVTYCDPELAHVGLTEQQAIEQGLRPTVLSFPFQDIDRALTDSETQGMSKLITHKGRVIGASILGPHAGELIHELVLAMKTGAKISDISATIHAYPTLSQIHRRVVNTAYAPKLFSKSTRSLVKLLNRLLP